MIIIVQVRTDAQHPHTGYTSFRSHRRCVEIFDGERRTLHGVLLNGFLHVSLYHPPLGLNGPAAPVLGAASVAAATFAWLPLFVYCRGYCVEKRRATRSGGIPERTVNTGWRTANKTVVCCGVARGTSGEAGTLCEV